MLAMARSGLAQSTTTPVPEATIRELQLQLQEQTQRLDALQDQLRQQEAATEIADVVEESASNGTPARPAVKDVPPEKDQGVDFPLDYFTDYKDGFVIRPMDIASSPFEMKVNGWIQFVHHAFARNVETWQDNAGITRPVRNRNAFDIERGRLVLSGTAIDPDISYFLQLDGDTDGEESVDFFDYWFAGQVTENLQLQFGKRKVPAGRQWLLSGRSSRLVDRPMSNDFFRPDRTTGIFGRGKLLQRLYYEWMVGNGYRTANLAPIATDNRFTYAATSYLDLNNDFGPRIVDFEHERKHKVLVGHSFVYSPQSGDALGLPLGEADFLRLADGTRLTQTGALAPGATVFEFDLIFYGLDAAWKWNGWSFNTEYFWRWINDLQADKPLPRSQIWQQGFYVEGGYFLLPQFLDANWRYSRVNGVYGNASEIAAGFNLYPFHKPTLRLAFDFTFLDGSPLQNTASNILVGDDGVLFRTMLQAEF